VGRETEEKETVAGETVEEERATVVEEGEEIGAADSGGETVGVDEAVTCEGAGERGCMETRGMDGNVKDLGEDKAGCFEKRIG